MRQSALGVALVLGSLTGACSTAHRDAGRHERQDADVEHTAAASAPLPADRDTSPEPDAGAFTADATPAAMLDADTPTSDAATTSLEDSGTLVPEDANHAVDRDAQSADPVVPDPEPEDLTRLVQDRFLANCSAWLPPPYGDDPVFLNTSTVIVACSGKLGKLDLASGTFSPLASYTGDLKTVRVSAAHLVFVDAEGLKSAALAGGVTAILATDAASPIRLSYDGRFVVFPNKVFDTFATLADGSSESWALPKAISSLRLMQPHGTRLLYTETDDSVRSYDIATREIIELVPIGVGFGTDPEITTLAWVESSTHKLWTVNADGTARREWGDLKYQPNGVVKFTPDGQKLVLSLDGRGLGLLSLATGESLALTPRPVGDLWGTDVVNTGIVYQLGHRKPMSPVTDWFELCAVPFNGQPLVSFGTMQSFLLDNYWEHGAAFSKDRSLVMFADGDGGRSVVDLASLTAEKVVRDVGRAVRIDVAPQGFSPDGTRIYYNTCNEDGSSCSVTVVNRDGHHAVTVERAVQEDELVKFSPDSQYVVVRSHVAAEFSDVLVHLDADSVATLPGSTNEHYVWIDARRLLVERDGLRVISVP